jgi:polysaccharide export outer membrane protein
LFALEERPMRLTRSATMLALTCLASGAACAVENAYEFQPGDILAISVWKEPTLQGDYLIRPDGNVSFPLIGEISTSHRTVAELQKTIVDKLKGFISDPVVAVSVREIRGNKIYVIGQVVHGGEFVVNLRVNIVQALSMAGGLTPFASLDNISVLRRTADGQQALPFHFSEVVHGRNLAQNIDLQPGDVVVVP